RSTDGAENTPMTHTITRRAAVTATALLTSAAVLAGCTSTAGGDSNETTTNGADSDIMPATEPGIIGGDDAAGEPVNGGTLTFSGYSLPPALDPSDKRAQASGSTGG